MEALKWLAITAGSMLCGYFWHKLTGNWTAATVFCYSNAGAWRPSSQALEFTWCFL
jgi:hypothetical protein